MNETEPQNLNNIPPPVLPENPKSKLLWYIVGVVSVIGIGIISFLIWNQHSYSSNPDSQMIIPPENLGSDHGASSNQPGSQVLDTSTWKTYRNDEYGFEMQYPDTWELELPSDERRGMSFHLPRIAGAEYDTTLVVFPESRYNEPFTLQERIEELLRVQDIRDENGVEHIHIANEEALMWGGIGCDPGCGGIAHTYNPSLVGQNLSVYVSFNSVPDAVARGNNFALPWSTQEKEAVVSVLSTFRFTETEQESGEVILNQGDPVEIKGAAIIQVPNCATRPHAAFGPGYWLVACGSVLHKYENGNFSEVYRFSEGEHVNLSEWNGEYFLVGGKNLRLDYPNSFLYTFNGLDATLVSSSLEGSVGGMSWNGFEWLIVTGVATYFEGNRIALVWSEYPLQVRLYTYDEKTVRNITKGIKSFGFGSGIAFLANDGKDWLIGGTETQLDLLSIDPVHFGDSLLVQYDGTVFTDFSGEVIKAQGKFLSDIEGNGDYFVIIGSNPEEKPWIGVFDNSKFSVLSVDTLFNHINQLSGVVWTGSYWIIADASGTGIGAYGYNTEPLRIVAFNGKEFSRVGKVAGSVLIGGQGEIGEGIVLFAGVNNNGQGILISVPVANELVQ